jgi:hypothetical protein
VADAGEIDRLRGVIDPALERGAALVLLVVSPGQLFRAVPGEAAGRRARDFQHILTFFHVLSYIVIVTRRFVKKELKFLKGCAILFSTFEYWVFRAG